MTTNAERLQLITRLRATRVKSGLFNCHVPGLHSIVLDRREDGSLLRIFYADPAHRLYRLFTADGSFTLGGHNHDKRLEFTTLFGAVHQVAFFPTTNRRDTMALYRYPFGSALESGQFELGAPDEIRAIAVVSDLGGVTMETHEFHTVLVPSMSAAWLVDEGPPKHTAKSILSPTPLSLDAKGLYVPMDGFDLRHTCETIATHMEIEAE